MRTARQLLMSMAVLGLLLTSTVVNAQSGTRNPVSSGGSRGSGGGSRGIAGSNNGLGQFSRSLTAQEGALRGFSDLVRSNGEAKLLGAQAVRELEQARSIYIENQLQVARFRQEQRAAKKQEIERLRQERKRRRSMEMPTDNPMDQWEIDWPEQLTKSRYSGYRMEIEELAILFAELEHNSGVEAGLRKSIEHFAQKIKMDEVNQLLNDNDSKIVRTFVTELYNSNGQHALKKKMDGMLVDR